MSARNPSKRRKKNRGKPCSNRAWKGATGPDDLGYKAIVDLLPCYISVQDRSLEILQVNRTLRNDFGDVVGKKCHEAYKNSKEKCPSCPVMKTFEDKGVHISEETVQLASGEAAQMIVYSAPVLDPFDNVVAVIELSTNISKVKEMQKELAFLGQSVAALSHDMRNMIESLQGGAYVVDQGLRDGDQELVKKGWGIVKKNISEVSYLVQNILYTSKKRPPTYKQVAPGNLLKEVTSLFYEKANSLGVELREEYNPNLPLVAVDGSAIRRMLSNLVLNALEACRRDNEKSFHTISVRADFYDVNNFMFEVEDNGTGMDDFVFEKLFTDFFSTKGVDGTGLGLSVVHKIVTEHGGRIDVLTSPGKGSLFRTILKLRHPQDL